MVAQVHGSACLHFPNLHGCHQLLLVVPNLNGVKSRTKKFELVSIEPGLRVFLLSSQPAHCLHGKHQVKCIGFATYARGAERDSLVQELRVPTLV